MRDPNISIMVKTIKQGIRAQIFLGILFFGIGLAPIAAIAKPSNPVIRADPSQAQNQVQQPDCYIKLSNQLVQDLSALCGKSAAPTNRMIDMNMDQNQDGMPDELMVEFQSLNTVLKVKPSQARNAQEELASYQRQVRQTIAKANERLPYANSTKAAMQEMNQILEQMDGLRSRPSPDRAEAMFKRMATLHEQVQQDPMYQKVQGYYTRFNQTQSSR
jgi:hypothetical protein